LTRIVNAFSHTSPLEPLESARDDDGKNQSHSHREPIDSSDQHPSGIGDVGFMRRDNSSYDSAPPDRANDSSSDCATDSEKHVPLTIH
ncbi:MAG: hypothetical protein AB7I48_27425, partial [Planctomycetaceae bacterium]